VYGNVNSVLGLDSGHIGLFINLNLILIFVLDCFVVPTGLYSQRRLSRHRQSIFKHRFDELCERLNNQFSEEPDLESWSLRTRTWQLWPVYRHAGLQDCLLLYSTLTSIFRACRSWTVGRFPGSQWVNLGPCADLVQNFMTGCIMRHFRLWAFNEKLN